MVKKWLKSDVITAFWGLFWLFLGDKTVSTVPGVTLVSVEQYVKQKASSVKFEAFDLSGDPIRIRT